MTDTPRVAIISAMPSELQPVVRMLRLQRAGEQAGTPVYAGTSGEVEVVATSTGVGPELALTATRRLLRSTRPVRVIVCGIAGGLPPVSVVGDLIVPEAVIDKATGERFVATAAGDVALHGVIRTGDALDYRLDDHDVAALCRAGIIALDMETAAIARVCREHGVPWSAFRAISDLAGTASLGPDVMALVNPDGRPRVLRSLGYLLTHPRRIPELMRVGRDARTASHKAARAAVASVRA